MIKAVVTGGAGFLGSHMVDLLLEQGVSVYVLDNMSSGRWENLTHHRGNCALHIEEGDIRTVPKTSACFRDATWVFHFAGIGDIIPSIERPEEYFDVNVQGTVHVLEAARWAGVEKFVYAASSSCYGLAPTPTDEHAPIQPQYPYACSKYLGEQVACHWHRVYRLPVNSIRIFNAYGTRSRTSGTYGAVMGVFMKQKLEGKPFTVVGDGTQTRDFVYATDVAQAFYLAATTPLAGEIFNLGAGHPQSVLRLVELLGGAVIHMPKRPGEPDCTWADIGKIKRTLGWTQHVSFEEGIARMLSTIEYWRAAPLWDTDAIAISTKTWFDCLSPISHGLTHEDK